MQYFNTLPSITQTDFNGNLVSVTNLLTRGYLLPSLQNNVMLFYQYQSKSGDTPENIAYRYYNDVNRFWIVLYGNQIIDPQFDLSLEDSVLMNYIINKYQVQANTTDQNVLAWTQANVHHYEKTVVTQNSNDQQYQSITIQIDQNTYNLTQPGTTTRTFPDGTTVTQTITTNAVSYYDYEIQQNESKRTINLIKNTYTNQMESQLSSLMAK